MCAADEHDVSWWGPFSSEEEVDAYNKEASRYCSRPIHKVFLRELPQIGEIWEYMYRIPEMEPWTGKLYWTWWEVDRARRVKAAKGVPLEP